ncbi:MAG: dual specificity protein phosphatase family protein [Nitrososphaerales archaeon]
MSAPGNLWRKIYGAIAKKPTNFSWVIDGMLAGSGMPTSKEELDWVRESGIEAVLTLTEETLPEEWLDKIDYLHVPTINGAAPDIENIERAADFIDKNLKNNKSTMVHCAAGRGRSGTILAAYMMKFKGMGAKNAIQMIRKMRPGSVENGSQEIALSLFDKYLKSKQ